MIEIMVVLVIIGLLAGVLAVNVKGHYAKANIKVAKLQIGKLANLVDEYKQEHGKYPEASQGLIILTVPAEDTGIALISQKEIIDPWKNEYLLLVPGDNGAPYEIRTLGSDGKPGGEGEASDISNLDL